MSSLLHLRPPFRAEHIGSLKRPDELLQKRAQLDQGKISPAELQIVEDNYIAEIVAQQRNIGIKAVTDGEFRRHMFYDGVFDNMVGMKYLTPVPQHMFMTYVPDILAFQEHDFKNAASYICVDKLERTRPFYKDQFLGLAKFVPPEEVKNIKLTMCVPHWFHLRHGPYAYPKTVYKNDAEYFADIAKAYREELAELYSVGCRNIQFDDPMLAYFCAESMLDGMEKDGIDHEALLDLYISTYNSCLKEKPADMTAGVHLCRGNFKDGRHFAEGGYDRIAIKLFNELNVDTYYLEYDTERAGTFEPLKFLPPDKSLVLGLISTKIRQLEDIDDLERRVRAAAEIVANGQQKRTVEEALNQLCISPQCGFASHSEGNLVTAEDVQRKLTLVVNAAKRIWPSSA
ncbi:UROD/MetE-like protein [Gautieria morchelliformis]|nr:UROD/MetE-like protein [Gautieria morchelliformis]